MHLINAQIMNFRGIEQLRLEFEPGFHLITGDNGKGKTSILDALAAGLEGILSGIEEITAIHFTKDEINKVFSTSENGSCECSYSVPVEVTMVANIDGINIPVRWIMSRSSIHASKSSIQPKDTANVLRRLSKKSEQDLPVLSYQGAGRAHSLKLEKIDNIFRKKYARTAGYIEALSESTNIRFLFNWCAKMEQTPEYETVMNTLSEFATRINGGEPCKFFYDKRLDVLMYRNAHGILPVSHQSTGFQSLLWMVFDIACRMAILNPHKKEEIAKTSGIVLIDELELYLHHEWQSKVIDTLREVFPNVQFIAASHTPTLAESVKDVKLIHEF